MERTRNWLPGLRELGSLWVLLHAGRRGDGNGSALPVTSSPFNVVTAAGDGSGHLSPHSFLIATLVTALSAHLCRAGVLQRQSRILNSNQKEVTT